MKCKIGDSVILSSEKNLSVREKKNAKSRERGGKNASVGNRVFENFSFSANNGKCEVQSFGCPKKNQSEFRKEKKFWGSVSWALCCETWQKKVKVAIAGES
jgi:hypothetical protein